MWHTSWCTLGNVPMINILIIDHDPDTMMLLKSWLEKKAYKVRFTHHKQYVADMIKDFEPDLIIVDVLQKGVIEELKQIEGASTLPILLMTGHVKKFQDKLLPVDDIIEKPFYIHLLEKKIQTLTEKNRKPYIFS